MSKNYATYIITNKPNGTLYIGVTNNLPRRIYEHQTSIYAGFSQRYELNLLVWYEFYDDIREAIAREKQLKHWKRDWKITLIEKMNPTWQDLSQLLNQ